jgi:hypothetical protein
MRSMTQAQMVKVFVAEATDAMITEACLVMDHVAPGHKLKHGTQEGWFNCNTIEFDGVPVAVLWWYKTRNNAMFVEAVAQLHQSKQSVMPLIFQAVDILVKKNGFGFVDFQAVRLGMVMAGKDYGFKVTGVTMRKRYD